MTYSWRIRTSGVAEPIVDANGNVLKDDPRFKRTEIWPDRFVDNQDVVGIFRTPKRFSDGIIALSPQNGVTVDLTPFKLQWFNNKDPDVFYYEIRASKDPKFNTDPETATDAVWHNLIHGGITSPPNSWQTPELEPGAQYYWEVRPRVQGDGTPVDWSKTFEFRTSPPPATKSVSGLAEVLDQN